MTQNNDPAAWPAAPGGPLGGATKGLMSFLAVLSGKAREGASFESLGGSRMAQSKAESVSDGGFSFEDTLKKTQAEATTTRED